LINDFEEDEIVAVLAHEVGHYKRKQHYFNLSASILLTGLTLLFYQYFKTPQRYFAIGRFTSQVFHAALIGCVELLYSPNTENTGLIMTFMS